MHATETLDIDWIMSDFIAEQSTPSTFAATVIVAGESRQCQLTESHGIVRLADSTVISYRHRTGKKSYPLRHVQVVKRGNGVYVPTAQTVLRRPAYPQAWGICQNTTTRNH